MRAPHAYGTLRTRPGEIWLDLSDGKSLDVSRPLDFLLELLEPIVFGDEDGLPVGQLDLPGSGAVLANDLHHVIEIKYMLDAIQRGDGYPAH
jgi:hypothetical protein